MERIFCILLGFILTDGHIAYKVPPRNYTCLQIELKSDDVDVLEKLKKAYRV